MSISDYLLLDGLDQGVFKETIGCFPIPPQGPTGQSFFILCSFSGRITLMLVLPLLSLTVVLTLRVVYNEYHLDFSKRSQLENSLKDYLNLGIPRFGCVCF